MKNKLLSVLFGVAVFFLIITLSISLPIYCRFFYFLHIEPLGLAEYSGHTVAEIKDAYNEVLNYLTLPFTTFGVGVFRYSNEGAAHFADCKKLFMLNASVLIVSAAVTTVLLVLKKKKRIEICRAGGLSPAFYAAIAAIIIPLVIGGLAATDFDKAFVVFHKIFFPGKDNWIFSSSTDEIINVLPQKFFMNCAIFIGAGLIIFSAAVIITEIVLKQKRKKH